MTLADIPLVLLAGLAVSVVIADLGMDRARRARLAADHEAWWRRLRRTPWSRIVAEAADRSRGPARMPREKGRPRLRFVAGGLAAAVLAAGGILTVGAFFVAKAPMAVVVHASTYFAFPGVVSALASLFLAGALFRRIGRATGVWGQLTLAVALVAGTAVLWIALMHAGTWLEWRHKRTPTVYGSEWFYAEAYMEYVREPPGLLVSVAAAVMVGLPAASFLARALLSMGGKLARPALAPVGERVARGFAGARPGAYAAGAVLLMIVVGLVRGMSAS